MEPNPVTVDDAIQLLNEMLATDPIATNALFCASAPVNRELADHPTIQVAAPAGWSPTVRLLGLLNGIFGADGQRIGWICADYDDGQIVRFRRTPHAGRATR